MSPRDADVLERIADATELLVKLALRQVQGDRTQTDMILLLDSLGCPPGKIAEYLGTTTATVYPTLSRSRKRRS